MKKLLYAAILLLIVCGTSEAKSKKNKVKVPKAIKERYVEVPATLSNPGGTKSTHRFLVSKYEVSNLDYREYLYWLKTKGPQEEYQLRLTDTTNWNDDNNFNHPFTELYFRHPAYEDYPLVNVRHENAVAYCKWLTERLNQLDWKGYKVIARLPNKDEWQAIARGGHEDAVYSLGGYYLRDYKGKVQYNIKSLSAENIHFNDSTQQYEIINNKKAKKPVMLNAKSDGYLTTAPVSSYLANPYGVYNMCGNVAEMVAEEGEAYGGGFLSTGYDARIESSKHYTESAVDIGFRVMIEVIPAQ